MFESMASHKNPNKGGTMVRYEPMDMRLIAEDPKLSQDFSNAGCMWFFQKLQGYHAQVSKYIAINFIGIGSKVGSLNFAVSLDTIA